MRLIASSLLLACFGAMPLQLQAASTASPAPSKDTPSAVVPATQDTDEQKAFGVREETPNQRRIRLGEPIVESFAAPDYGELIETPNQQRKRHQGIPVADATNAVEGARSAAFPAK
jgi:hypothetical protein